MSERLEEIINDLPYSIKYEGNTENLINYAKEQAERVREMEEHITLLNEQMEETYVSWLVEDSVDMKNILIDAGKKNRRYRKAIERAFVEFRYGDAFKAELILAEALEDEE